MDANQLTKMRSDFLENGTLENFSAFMKAHRKGLLAAVLDAMKLSPFGVLESPSKKKLDGNENRPDKILRFETLMWGGDESLFVLPAECALHVLIAIQDFLEDASRNKPLNIHDKDRQISYGIGVVIGRHKAPIRQLKNRAEALCTGTKKISGTGYSRSLVDIEVLLGHDVPFEPVEAMRKRRFLSDHPTLYQLNLSYFASSLEAFAQIQGEDGNSESGIPRTKLRAEYTKFFANNLQGNEDKEARQKHLCNLAGEVPNIFQQFDETFWGERDNGALNAVISTMRLWDYGALYKNHLPLDALSQEEE